MKTSFIHRLNCTNVENKAALKISESGEITVNFSELREISIFRFRKTQFSICIYNLLKSFERVPGGKENFFSKKMISGRVNWSTILLCLVHFCCMECRSGVKNTRNNVSPAAQHGEDSSQ